MNAANEPNQRGDTMDQHYFVFREPANINELKALLLLRYSVYRASRLHKFCPENEAGIDLDCYDLYSRHFGLYEHSGATSRPVGYVRMVTDKEGTFHDELFRLAGQSPSLFEKINRVPPNPFPVMNYAPDSEQIGEYYNDAKARGEMFVEVSRLSLDGRIRGLKVVTNFVSSIFAAYQAMDVDHAIISCHSEHSVFYQHFGAKGFAGSQPFYCEQYDGAATSLLLLSPKTLPDTMKERVLQMAEAFRITGRICYDPSNPQQFYAPLGSYMESRPVFTAIAA